MYNSMNYIGKFISNFRDFYNEINAATLTGAIDVVVVQQPDGSYTCSPFHVRFGKLGVLRSREKVVDIEINSEPRQIHMKLGDSGEAFFVEEVPGSDGSPSDSDIPPHLACSPIPNDDECFGNRRFNVLSELPQEQHEKILRDSVMSIEREKWEQMSALPPDLREKFLVEHFSDLPLDQREKWLQIASLTTEERDKIFQEYYGSISTLQKQRMISEQYSALKTEDKERLFKENFPELPAEQRQSFEKALLSDWQKNNKSSPKKSLDTVGDDDEDEVEEEEEDDDDKDKSLRFNDDEEIFDMEGVTPDEKPKTPIVTNPKSFVAVTSTERIRKISVVNNDFRPINENDSSDQFDSKGRTNEELTPASHIPLSSSSSSSSTKRNSKDESTADETKTNISSSKRKRKRKSTMKRKGMQRKISASSNVETTAANNSNQAKTVEVPPTIEIVKVYPDDIELKAASKDETKNIPEEDQLNKINVTHASTDFHFFSDTEITAKNKESRPSSPVQSDTEFEVQKITQESKAQEDKGQSWRWGELPSPPHDGVLDAHGRPLNPADAIASNNEKKTADEEDAESGNGPSLPQSPNSVEGAIGGPKSLDSDFDESSSKHFEPSLEVAMSLCGNLDSTTDAEPSDELFQRHVVRFEDVCSDAKLFENPNLVVKVNGKYYNWAAACAVVMTYTAFQKHLPHSILANLYEDRKRSASDSKVDRSNSRGSTGYSSWFSWRRSSQPAKKSSNHDNSALSPTEMNQSEAVLSKDDGTDSFKTTIVINDESNKDTLNDQMTTSLDSIETSQSLVSFTDAVDDSKSDLQTNLTNKEADREGYNAGNEEGDSDEEQQLCDNSGIDIPSPNKSNLSATSAATDIPKREGTPNYRKTLRLSSEQIASLNLREGTNECVFSVTTAYQGTTRCKCSIYKWRWDDKIVISDIDGTITKSDVLGHILPIVGKDWAQSGVAQLFTKIKNNGYKLLYLSARAIGQARVTREYLRSIRQDDLSLPDGPLLLNPTSLISAFHREVIEKKPEQFKISCLSDIKALFPEGSQPFYAGYGNRINDVWAYRAVGIPTTRIFTINHRGELKHELTQTFQSTYSNMSYIVDHVYPAIREDVADEFSNFSYWREPIQDLQQEMLAMQN